MAFDRMGIRGIAHESVTSELVCRYAEVAARHLAVERMVIGRDTRTTGELFVYAATVGLLRAGVDVDNIGIVPTPALQRYVEVRDIAGLQITASHNPPEYNGVKVVGTDGSVLKYETTRELQKAVQERGKSPDRNPDGGPDIGAVGSTRQVEGANQAYVESIVDSIDHTSIRQASPKVVVDTGNGAGGLTSPELFRRLGCRVQTLNAQPDGTFPGRAPEPTKEALSALRSLVTTQDANLGIAHDGDADRTIIIDETGRVVDGNVALAALVRAELGTGETMVTPVNASQSLVNTVGMADGDLVYTRIGNAHILDRIRELQADGVSVPIAGEGNGGVIYPEHRLGRDGGYTAAKFLQLIAHRQASTLLEPHRGYHFRRHNILYDDESEKKRILEAAEAWTATVDGDVTTIDGYRVDFDDGWILVRPSGTEPYIRVYAESESEQRTTSLISTVESELNSVV